MADPQNPFGAAYNIWPKTTNVFYNGTFGRFVVYISPNLWTVCVEKWVSNHIHSNSLKLRLCRKLGEYSHSYKQFETYFVYKNWVSIHILINSLRLILCTKTG